ncbi:hypothetical protein ACHAAC_04380 [Aeromicrobium sp. CF4.19]|uniref:hypothetical protein n=1 Tax=Aeromicrobium sp. CF4.19 TaxID=3373082 RepID=UPI003EE49B37
MKMLRSVLAVVMMASMLILGQGLTSSASAAPQCEGEYKPGVVCETGTFRQGFYQTPLACDRQGRYYVDTVRQETSDGPVGWYTWECDSYQTVDGQVWLLLLRGLVKK